MTVTVTSNDLVVAITTPAANSNNFSGSSLVISGTAAFFQTTFNDITHTESTTNLVAQITKVEVKLGGAAFALATKVGSTFSQWTITRPMTEALANAVAATGKLTITAKATAGALSREQAVTVNVDTLAPTLAVISPAAGALLKSDGGAPVIFTLTGSAADGQSGLLRVETQLNGGAFGQTTVSGGNWSATVTLPKPGKYTIGVRAVDNQNNSMLVNHALEAALPFHSTDPDDLVGLAAYLDDLLLFSDIRVTGDTTRPVLATTLMQRFDLLSTAAQQGVARQPVVQARMAVELLRRYLALRLPSLPAAAQGALAAGQTEYLAAAYEAVLAQLGVSAAEVRAARTADSATRDALAARLEVLPAAAPDDPFAALAVPAAQLSETKLEQLFGLADTSRDPFAAVAAMEPQLLALRTACLRSRWQEEDERRRTVLPPAAPVCDPDLVGAGRRLPGNPATALLEARSAALNNITTSIRNARNGLNSGAGFAAAINAALGAGAATTLAMLAQQEREGADVSASLAPWGVTAAIFRIIISATATATAGLATDDDFALLLEALVTAHKRQLFAQWHAEERTAGVLLSPDFFRLSAEDELAPVATLRLSASERLRWEETLAARSEQLNGLRHRLAQAVEAAEQGVLSLLRDRLLDVIAVATSKPAAVVADGLSQELAVDFAADGVEKSHRLQQGVACLQSQLFSLRTGRLATVPPVAGASPVQSWRIESAGGFGEQAFDEEWKLLGSHAGWRAAMQLFLYPENSLLPMLRPVAEQTAAFHALLARLRDLRRLSPVAARTEAAAFLAEVRAEIGAGLPAKVTDPGFFLTDQLTDAQLIVRRTDCAALIPTLAAAQALHEIFYFVPMHLAAQLEQAGEYLTALDWYQTVFAYHFTDVTGTGVDERVIYHGFNLEKSIPTQFLRSVDWLRVKLNPHEQARSRAGAQLRYTLSCIARCFLAFADDRFAGDTEEAAAQARGLFESAQALLNEPVFAPLQLADGTQLPDNPLLTAQRARAEIALFKLRNRQNPLGLVGATRQRPSPFRFAVLAERARQLTALAGQVEGAFLAALERRDAEAYSVLQAQQDAELTGMTVQLQELRLTEARDGVSQARLQREQAQLQVEHFDGLLVNESIQRSQDWALAFTTLNQLLGSMSPIFGVPGGVNNINATAISAKAATGMMFGLAGGMFAQQASAFLNMGATIASDSASRQIQQADWSFQAAQGRIGVRMAQQQMRAAAHHVATVQQEGAIARRQADHAVATLNFLLTKFTNVELFEWMSGVLEGIYRFFLQQATATARLAERQLRFERQENVPALIRADYWQAEGVVVGSDRRGLTGSTRLLQDLTQLEQFAFDSDRRKLQVSRTFSLAQLSPLAFEELRRTGRLVFSTPGAIFDREFPGHYLRLIKRVRLSVVALLPAIYGIRATFTNLGVSRVVVENNGFETVTVAHGPQSVALTAPLGATGLFELDAQPEMLLPFEGFGVDTAWRLDLPKAANPFDYRTLADVLVTVEYTALESPVLRRQVIRTLDTRVNAERVFSLRSSFPDAWYDLHNPAQNEQSLRVNLQMTAADFPPNLAAVSVKELTLLAVQPEGERVEFTVRQLLFTPADGAPVAGTAVTTIGGIVSTRQGNGAGWQPVMGRSPVGRWELALELARALQSALADERIDDLLLVVGYQALTPDWPL